MIVARRNGRVELDHLVVLKSQADNHTVRINLLMGALYRLVRGMPDFKLVKSDIQNGCIEVAIPSCEEKVIGGVSPGEVKMEIKTLNRREKQAIATLPRQHMPSAVSS
jgi:hypothetical protein